MLVAVDHKLQSNGFNYVFGELISLAPAIVLVVGCAVGFRGLVGTVLAAPPIRFLGQISYGIYLYHPFAWAGASWSAERLNIPLAPMGPVTFAVGTVATIAVAAFSWYALELPLNRLKTRFHYGRGSRSDGKGAFSPSAGATPT
jgi:peptidoglycan/LPS O-acetylase OafA/YrhL